MKVIRLFLILILVHFSLSQSVWAAQPLNDNVDAASAAPVKTGLKRKGFAVPHLDVGGAEKKSRTLLSDLESSESKENCVHVAPVAQESFSIFWDPEHKNRTSEAMYACLFNMNKGFYDTCHQTNSLFFHFIDINEKNRNSELHHIIKMNMKLNFDYLCNLFLQANVLSEALHVVAAEGNTILLEAVKANKPWFVSRILELAKGRGELTRVLEARDAHGKNAYEVVKETVKEVIAKYGLVALYDCNNEHLYLLFQALLEINTILVQATLSC